MARETEVLYKYQLISYRITAPSLLYSHLAMRTTGFPDLQELTQHDTKVTLKRNPKTDGPRRATQKGNMECREQNIITNLQVHNSCELG